MTALLRAPWRRPLPVALLVCAGIMGGLVVAEVGLRLALGDSLILQAQEGVPDDSIAKRARRQSAMNGATFSYDESGFRTGSGLPYDRSVLFLGDSFTEGFGVGDDDTFARATERALRSDGIMARSVNAGHRGFGAAQELKVLRRILAAVPVDAVVIQSFPMNDFSDNLAFGGFGVEDGHLIEYETRRAPLRARLSAVVSQSWLRNLYVLRLANNAMLRGDPAAPFDAPTSFELERALLREIIAAVGTRPVVVLVVPTRLVQQVQHGVQPDPRQLGEIRRFEEVCAFMKESGVPWIDAGEVITDLAADAAKGDGGHFSRDGNALIGAAIAQRLQPLLARGGTEGRTIDKDH